MTGDSERVRVTFCIGSDGERDDAVSTRHGPFRFICDQSRIN